MSLSFQILTSKFGKSEIERFSQSMTSSDPPLSKDARAEIERIELSRLNSLVGEDKYQAGLFFEILSKLPPIEGPRATKFLTIVAETDFLHDTLQNILQNTLNEMKTDPKTSEHIEPNDYGFVTLPGKLSYLDTHDSDVEVTFDKKKSDRDGVKTMVELYLALAAVTDPATRVLIAQDCKLITDLRLCFEFS